MLVRNAISTTPDAQTDLKFPKAFIGFYTLVHWVTQLNKYLRRRSNKKRWAAGEHGPKLRNRSHPKAGTIRLRWLLSGWLAFWTKYTIKYSKIADYVYLGRVSQLGIVLFYLLLNFLCIFLGTNNDIDWMAHHSARLVYAQMPIIIGLAGKNNVLSFLTGFAYENLNVFHRWAGRCVILFSAIHIGGRIYVNVPSAAPTSLGGGYIAWGWVAFALFIYLVAMASRSIRNRAYQFFLIQHIVLWFVIVASLVIHRPQDQKWIWVGFAVHLADRIARGLRIFLFRIVWPIKEDDDRPSAWVDVLGKDTMRVSVRTRQTWLPAQHAYLHVPTISPGGHPLTISNVCRPVDQMDQRKPKESVQEFIIRVREGKSKAALARTMMTRS